MKLPKLEDLNSERFLDEAFEPEFHEKLVRDARVRRNVYFGLCLISFVCIFIAALMERMTLSILSLFLSTISLVVMTKYDTQLFFLKVLQLREKENEEG